MKIYYNNNMKTGQQLREEAERQKRMGDAMQALNYAAKNYPLEPRPNMTARSDWERMIRANQRIAEHSYADGYKDGFQAAQPEWRYLPELPDNRRLVHVAYQVDMWTDAFLDEAIWDGTEWKFLGNLEANPNWKVFAWKDKTFLQTPPLPPAKNQ